MLWCPLYPRPGNAEFTVIGGEMLGTVVWSGLEKIPYILNMSEVSISTVVVTVFYSQIMSETNAGNKD